jgi:hypothetical protein
MQGDGCPGIITNHLLHLICIYLPQSVVDLRVRVYRFPAAVLSPFTFHRSSPRSCGRYRRAADLLDPGQIVF